MRRLDLDLRATELLLYGDLLSPWCYVAERRLEQVVEEFGGAYVLVNAPFPLRPEPHGTSARERRQLAAEAGRAAREPEGRGLCGELWRSPDPPESSLAPLAALEAAGPQGPLAARRLRRALQEAALLRGVNVARTHTLLEIAGRAGLDVERFAAQLRRRRCAERVRDSHRDAVDRGIEEVPALVVGDEWLVVGLRDTDEYRDVLGRYLARRHGWVPERLVH